MACGRAKAVDYTGFALVHLGICRRDAIGGLELDQTDLGALCRVRGVFLPREFFAKRRSQDRALLGRNHLWVPVGAVAGHGTTFRRTQSDARILSYLYLSPNEGSAPG